MAEQRRGEPASKAGKGIARKGTGPGAGGAKPIPEPYWLKKLRVNIQQEKRGRKLKRKTNRGTSRQSGR